MSRTIMRRLSALLALAVLAAATLALAPARAQSEEEAAPPAEAEVVATAAVALDRTETFTSGTWEVSVGEVFSAASPTRAGYTEVRVGITMKNIGPQDAAYRMDGFFSDPTYPRLAIEDGAGLERPLRPAGSTFASLPGSTLTSVLPGVIARWTVGFQVPDATVADIRLLVHGLEGSAAFDLSTPIAGPAVSPPANSTVIAIGDEIDWGDDFTATAYDHGSLLCGDPDRELVVQILAVGFEVGNKSTFDNDWPGVRFPDHLAVAQWPDGASARFAFETYAGDADPLFKWAEDAVRFPAAGGDAEPAAKYRRALLFGVPRDARVASVTDTATGVWLQPPHSDALWLDLSTPGTLNLSPALCDEGNLPFTVPFAFAPGAEFRVGLSPPPADPAAQDRAAIELLAQAAVIAGVYKGNNADSYANVSAAALVAVGGSVDFETGFVAVVDKVGVAASADPNGVPVVLLATQSSSGQLYCATLTEDVYTVTGAPTLEELEAACDPGAGEAVVEEG